jgi:hypothetical protein
MLKLISKLKMWIVIASTAVVTITSTVVILNVTQVRALKAQNEHDRQLREKDMDRLTSIIEAQYALIVDLARIEKYKIENRFEGKIKTTQASQLLLNLDNKLTQPLPTVIDTMPKPQSENLFKRFINTLKF